MRNATSQQKFYLVTTLRTRAGSHGDSILHGLLPDGTELIVAPERNRRAGPRDFILMANGKGFSGTFPREQTPAAFLPSVHEPYFPGASRRPQKQTAPEVAVRDLLNRLGANFSEQISDLPGTPDFYLPDFHIAVLAHGCFWHGHGCGDDRPPIVFGERHLKIAQARRRDPIVRERLKQLGIRTLTVWECALTGPRALPHAELLEAVEEFVTSDLDEREIEGRDSTRQAG
jgi:DNA mismatch endonuclease (patch repair protein)